ncbi:MAG: M50 family metallopeptidase [Eubacteriales bacterium]
MNFKGVLPTIISYTIFFAAAAITDCTIYTLYALLPFAAVFIHELGHIAAAALCGYKISSLTFYPVGIDIRLAGAPYGIRAVIIAAAGCAVNLLCFFVFGGTKNDAAALFAVSSLLYAAVNALPVETLDGGVLLSLALEQLCPRAAHKICRAVSFAGIAALWVLSVWILMRTAYNFTLFLMAAYLFATIFIRGAKSSSVYSQPRV